MFYKRKQPLVLFYSSRRGGSTLLAEIMEAARSTVYVDQPFDLWKPDTDRGRIIASFLPNKHQSQFFEMDDQEKNKITLYLDHFYKKKLLHLSTGKRAKHVVLKIVNAHGLIDELATLVPSKTVVLMRHPFSQSLSVMRNKWGTCEAAFIESTTWTDTYLTLEQLAFSKEVSEKGTYFEKAVLNWCLEWHYPMHHSKTKKLTLYYEDLVLDGANHITRLYEFLGFKEIQNGVAILNKPSKSSNFSTKATVEGIKNNDKSAMLSSWRSQLEEKDLVNAQKILDVFNVTVYSRFSDIPQL